MSVLFELLGLIFLRLQLKDKSKAKRILGRGPYRRFFMGKINIDGILINVSKSIIREPTEDEIIAGAGE